MKLRYVIAAFTLLLAVVTGGVIAGAMMLPAAAGAEVELSSLEGKIKAINQKLDRLTQQLEQSENQIPEEHQPEQVPRIGFDSQVGPPGPST